MKRNKNFEKALNGFAEGILMVHSSSYSNYREFKQEYIDIVEECDCEFLIMPLEAFNDFHRVAKKELLEYEYAKGALYSLKTKHIPGAIGYPNTVTNCFLSDVLDGSIKINSKALIEFMEEHAEECGPGVWLRFDTPYIDDVRIDEILDKNYVIV